jgi:hypothetical protein
MSTERAGALAEVLPRGRYANLNGYFITLFPTLPHHQECHETENETTSLDAKFSFHYFIY